MPRRPAQVELVGRYDETHAITEVLADALGRRSRAVAIVGEPGIGKSALLAHAEGQWPGQILRLRGYEAEAGTPFCGLTSLVGPLEQLLPELLPFHANVLKTAIGRRAGAPPDVVAAGAALLALLAAAAEGAPVLVVVDDAHWIDPESLGCLLFAARRLGTEGIAMLIATRPDEPGSPAIDAFVAVQLAPLDDDAARSLLETTAGELDDGVRDSILKAARGNPLALIEFPRLLTEGGQKARATLADGGRRGRLQDVYASRIARLEAETRLMLVVIALARDPDRTVVSEVSRRLGIDPDAHAGDVLRGLIEIKGPRFEFVHPVVGSLVRQTATAVELASAHEALAATLTARAPEQALLHRVVVATPPAPSLADELDVVARDALARGAPAAASRAFARAADFSDTGDLAASRLLEAARASQRAEQTRRALELCRRALESVRDPRLRMDILHLYGLTMALSDQGAEGLEVLRQAAERAIAIDHVRAARLFVDAAVTAMQIGDPRHAHSLAAKGEQLAADAPEPLPTLARVARASPATRLGIPEVPMTEAEADTLLAHAANDPQMVYRICVNVVSSLMLEEEYARSRSILVRLVVWARDQAPSELIYPLVVRAKVDYRSAPSWTQALAGATHSAELAMASGNNAVASFCRTAQALIEAGRGREEACEAALDEAIELADATETGGVSASIPAIEGQLAVSLGDHERCVAALAPLQRDFDRSEFTDPGAMWITQNLIEAYIGLEQRSEAERTLERFEQAAARRNRHWAQAAAARSHALMAEPAEALGLFETALAHHARTTTPFEEARTRLAYGLVAAAHGQRSLAERQLNAAESAFTRLGCGVWVDRARSGRGDGSAPSVNIVDTLTPLELQIALVVAQGATNREAGAQLCLSHKTIENYLVRIYGKLGVRNRTELARQMESGQ